jgi:hypothetical protein
MGEQDRVRVAISMLREDYDELKELAEAENETVSGYLRKALPTERYIKERSKSGKILVEEDGVQREVIFR